MKQHKTKMIFSVLIVAILSFAFWYGGNAPGLRGWSIDSPKNAPVATVTPAPTPTEHPLDTTPVIKEAEPVSTIESQSDNNKESENTYVKNGMIIDEKTGKDQYLTDPVPEGKPIPVEPQDVVVSNQTLTCTLSVRCDSIWNHLEWLDPEKVEIVPENGVIYEERTVVFYDGESVFDVLLREMKQNAIHMEFEHTPLYNSAYIEGIANLYEFDCGELSGWMYRVNDWFPNYGCSRYQLKNGDRVEWIYTCELGADIGGYDAVFGN